MTRFATEVRPLLQQSRGAQPRPLQDTCIACANLRKMAGMSKRLAEVARKVGVSEATVSRVLNEKPGVSESTRQAVLTALDVLGYERPTKLRGERARLVGLVLPELQNPIFPAFAEIVGGCPRAAGLHAGPVHPDRRRRVGGRLRRAAAAAAGVGRGLRRRPLRAGRRAARPLRPARRAQPADRPRQRVDRGPAVPAGLLRRRGGRSSRRSGHLRSLGHTTIGLLLGPADHVPSAAQARGGPDARAERRRADSTRPASSTRCTRSRPPRPPAIRLLRPGRDRDRLRERPDGPRRDPGRPPGRPARAATTCRSSASTTRPS